MLHIITGGSGSGKSAYAEDYLVSLDGLNRVYIATMYPFDEESKKRIIRHKEMRADKSFETIECYTNVDKVQLPDNADVLLECLSNLVANVMYQEVEEIAIVDRILVAIKGLIAKAANVVIVTNEIFSDISDYSEETKRYQRYLGAINQELSRNADFVTEVVYGIPVKVKG